MKKGLKKWIMPTFEENDNPRSDTKTFGEDENTSIPIKEHAATNSFTHVPSLSRHTFNLIDKLTPKNVADLAVHSKKIQEVECWIKEKLVCRNKGTPMLLLTGPTGCGKTAVVKVLCKMMDIELVEWINPVNQDHWENYRGPGQTARLTEFLSDTSKFPSLFGSTDSTKKVTLLEDFPNSVVYNPPEFQAVLEKCYNSGSTPIVFICTDISDNSSNLSQTLFSQEIRHKYSIECVNFNPASSTLLKSSLRRASVLAAKYPNIFKVPSDATLDAIANSAMGDIRCAINQFQFACLNGSLPLKSVNEANENLIAPKNAKGTKRKRTHKSKCVVQDMLRDESLGLFHGLGRVLNPKRIESEGSSKILCDFNSLIEEFSLKPSMFCNFLHTNYLNYFGSFEDVSEAAEILSDAQVFLDIWQEKRNTLHFALWISVMGMMIANKNKVSRWNQIRGPTKITKSVITKEIQGIVPMEYCYYNIIKKCTKYPCLKF